MLLQLPTYLLIKYLRQINWVWFYLALMLWTVLIISNVHSLFLKMCSIFIALLIIFVRDVNEKSCVYFKWNDQPKIQIFNGIWFIYKSFSIFFRWWETYVFSLQSIILQQIFFEKTCFGTARKRPKITMQNLQSFLSEKR